MVESFEFVVTNADAGRRLDEFLASRFAALSRMRIANLIREGACLVNRLHVKPGNRIAEGDSIKFAFEEGPPTAMRPEALPLEIVFEDEHIIVVIKPAGMLVHPTKSVKGGTLANALAYHLNKEFYDSPSSVVRRPLSGNVEVESQPSLASVAEYISEHQNAETQETESRQRTTDYGRRTPKHGQAHSLIRPGLVHRLDRATSGLMVAAKTSRALSRLTIHFRRRLVEKRYLALVHGRLIEDESVIVAPIGRDPERQPNWWVIETGKQAETRLRVVERLNEATLVEMEPITGRTNQLRIHCAYRGHPIVGDDLYGEVGSRQKAVGSERNISSDEEVAAEDETIKSKKTDKVRTAYCLPPTAYCSRLCLHAWRLAFHHPASNEWMQFAAPLPRDFAALLDELRNNH